MNITFHSIDPVNAKLTITVNKEDYQTQVTKALKDLRKTVVIDGFRKGYAPASRIQTMYGKAVLFDEINKLVSDKLLDYINDSRLKIFGEPLLTKELKTSDFNSQEDFEFTFDLGLYPEVNVHLTKEDHVPYYTVAVTDEMIDARIRALALQHGMYGEAEEIESDDMVKGILTELNEDGTAKEGGIYKEGVFMFLYLAKNQEEKDKFLGAKRDQTLIFNPYKMYEGCDIELSSLLDIKKEKVNDHQGDFSFLITGISRYMAADLNQDLFDQIYKPGTITSEEALKEQIKLELSLPLVWQSNSLFFTDVKQLLLKKASDISFPDDFLKRWTLESGWKDTDEGIEKYYLDLRENLRYHLVEDKFLKENNITIDDNEIYQEAILFAKEEIFRYGTTNASADFLQGIVNSLLKNENTVHRLKHHVKNRKLIALWKMLVTLEPKELSKEEFDQLEKTKASGSQEQPD
jgi:trigger factor